MDLERQYRRKLPTGKKLIGPQGKTQDDDQVPFHICGNPSPGVWRFNFQLHSPWVRMNNQPQPIYSAVNCWHVLKMCRQGTSLLSQHRALLFHSCGARSDANFHGTSNGRIAVDSICFHDKNSKTGLRQTFMEGWVNGITWSQDVASTVIVSWCLLHLLWQTVTFCLSLPFLCSPALATRGFVGRNHRPKPRHNAGDRNCLETITI